MSPAGAGAGVRAEAASTATAPRPFQVRGSRRHTPDTVTLALEPAGGPGLAFRPGQFTMLGALGAGEAPISVSSDPAGGGPLEQTVRDVGGVTHTLATAEAGDLVTVRGPYGTGWDVGAGAGGDIAVVAGGIGLAPLRSALLEIRAHRERYGRVVLLYGARTPGEMVFREDLAAWSDGRDAIETHVTVDHAEPGWRGPVGLVTGLIPAAGFDPARALALVCGPETMMRHVAAALAGAGVPPGQIRLSLERNMACGVGLCGHCQLRELFICADGPVFSYARVAGLLSLRGC